MNQKCVCTRGALGKNAWWNCGACPSTAMIAMIIYIERYDQDALRSRRLVSASCSYQARGLPFRAGCRPLSMPLAKSVYVFSFTFLPAASCLVFWALWLPHMGKNVLHSPGLATCLRHAGTRQFLALLVLSAFVDRSTDKYICSSGRVGRGSKEDPFGVVRGTNQSINQSIGYHAMPTPTDHWGCRLPTTSAASNTPIPLPHNANQCARGGIKNLYIFTPMKLLGSSRCVSHLTIAVPVLPHATLDWRYHSINARIVLAQ